MKENKWTYPEFEKLLQDIYAKDSGKSIQPAYIDPLALMASYNTGFASFDQSTGQFKSNMGDSKLADAWTYYLRLEKAKLTGPYTSTNFQAGILCFYMKSAYGLKATGTWKNMNKDDIGFVELPKVTASQDGYRAVQTNTCGYGIVRGSTNPLSAGAFIKYYLDTANYKTAKGTDGKTAYDTAFLTPAARDFYFNLVKKPVTGNQFNLWSGVYQLTYPGGWASSCSFMTGTSPDDVSKKLTDITPDVTSMINRANNVLNNAK